MNPPLPPNQHLAAPGKWPLVGEKAMRADDTPWTVTVSGIVRHPRTWTLDELRAMVQVERPVDIHCVTRWSKLGARFGGVELRALIEACEPLPDARFLSFVARSERNHSTSLPIADALNLGALVALTFEGEPLAESHGGPVRIVTPGRYFYKSLKWLERIDILANDQLGYWEAEAGYHNEADPWLEQRYIARDIDAKTLRKALESRDFHGRDFLGLDARNRDLSGLNASNALLRNADFRHANLSGARFDSANLSNAHLGSANLRGASFREADVEGADFSGADLRGADFTSASHFGATFTGARIDASTTFEPSALEALTPDQHDYVSTCLQSPNER
jgi:DMSO/TMAO reductase YedYZ molybdopterin-dependent catalytic subunit